MLAELIVDLAAIGANIRALRSLVAPARVAAVVKANAYGHGLVPVARAIECDVDRLCVYELAEAVALRDAAVTAPIHVLGPIAPADLEIAHAAGAQVTLWDRGTYAAQVASTARRRRAPFAVQAKIDTGVTRLGVAVAEAPQALQRYAAQPEYTLAGVFSHLAAAEEIASTFTRDQLSAFERATAAFDPAVERHIAASAAAMLWPQTRLGAVRAGIAIYGIWPSRPTEAIMRERGLRLIPALTWRTTIVAIHDVPADTSVGYGCTFRTTRPSRIAVLPIGYAEGLPRSASNRGWLLVAGRRVPLVGRVCMNMAFVDVTDVPHAGPRAVVTLIGSDGDERIDAEEAAGWAGTIAYELVTRIPAHVPRRYDVPALAGR
ncbi:MAG: alanine racemase [Candidatus Velthaea sp.]